MKVRKIFTSLVCAAMALSMSLPVSAEGNEGIQPYGMATQCLECFGTVDMWVEEDAWVGTEDTFCIHCHEPGGADLKDYYSVYQRARLEKCRNCSYSRITPLGGEKRYVLILCQFEELT